MQTSNHKHLAINADVFNEVLEFLASLPGPEETVKLRPSKVFLARIRYLLKKNRTTGLTPEENQEWEQYQYLEHLVRMAKAKALLKLKKY